MVLEHGSEVFRRCSKVVPVAIALLLFGIGAAGSADSANRWLPPITDKIDLPEVSKTGPARLATPRSAVGQIAFNEDASTKVVSPFSGRVTRLLKGVGDDVTRGEPLFELDSPDVVQAQTEFLKALHVLEKAKAQLNLTKHALDRQLSLLAGKATSHRDVDSARNEAAAAESGYATAATALLAARNTLRVFFGRDGMEIERLAREQVVDPLITITAPIDGTVISRKIGPGQFLRSEAGEPLYSISDLSIMWLKAFVPEKYIGSIKIGQQIEVKIPALPDQSFTGRITSIGAASDQQSRRVVVRSEIENPKRLLKAEMFANVRIFAGSPTAGDASIPHLADSAERL